MLTERSRRVLFAINHLGRGGAETQLVRLAIEAKRAGHHVVILTMLPKNDFREALATDAIDVINLGLPSHRSILAGAVRTARVLRSVRPDVCVAFLFQTSLMLRLAYLVARPAVRISSMRNERLEGRLRSLLYRASCALDTYVVANSYSALRALQASRTIPRGTQARVVYNGVDPDRVPVASQAQREAVRRELGVDSETVVFVGIGRLSRQKDWGTLVRAVAEYDGPISARWFIAGEGEDEDHLASLIGRYGLGASISLLGLRDDIGSLLAAADCLVLCSRYEGTPNVILEALLAGVQVIASDVGACGELIGGHGGQLVQPANASQLAAAMEKEAIMLDQQDRAPRANLRASTLERFSWDRVAACWFTLMSLPTAPRPAAEAVAAR